MDYIITIIASVVFLIVLYLLVISGGKAGPGEH